MMAMSEGATITTELPKWRWLWRSLILLGGAVVLLVLGLAGWVAIASRDIPAPDVSDLMLPRIDVPAEQDADTHFNAAADALNWPNHPNEAGYKIWVNATESMLKNLLAR